jgi:hypothetical protein
MANETDRPQTFDSLPAWMTWVDIVEEFGDPNCRCNVCIALRAWIQQCADSTKMQLIELENLAIKLKKYRSEISADELKRLDYDLMLSALAAGVKLRKLIAPAQRNTASENDSPLRAIDNSETISAEASSQGLVPNQSEKVTLNGSAQVVVNPRPR